jgi:arginine:agmatine antiporter
MAIPYIYSVIAMWRLNRVTPEVTMGRRYLFRVLGVLACLYCVGVVLGQSAELVRKALVVLLLTVPFYALVRLPGHETDSRAA